MMSLNTKLGGNAQFTSCEHYDLPTAHHFVYDQHAEFSESVTEEECFCW